MQAILLTLSGLFLAIWGAGEKIHTLKSLLPGSAVLLPEVAAGFVFAALVIGPSRNHDSAAAHDESQE